MSHKGSADKKARTYGESHKALTHNRSIPHKTHPTADLTKQARFAALRADVGVALTQTPEQSVALNQCAQAIVDHLDAAFARIWTLSQAGDVLELQASAGLYTHLDGAHARVPVGAFKIGRIAEERKAHLTNDVASDERVSDREWARAEGMVAFAGYPLLVEDRLVGVLGLFARHPLAEDTLDAIASVAASLSVGIERKRTEAALRESESRFRATFGSAPLGMAITTLDGRLIETNQAYRDLTGFDGAELATKVVPDLIHPDDLTRNRELIQQLLNGEIPSFQIETRYICKYKSIWVRATATLLRDREGHPREVIGLVEDISDRKDAEQERERLLGELARSNDELSQFAHVAAHDLRSPLRTIRSYTQLLERRLGDRLDGSNREFMQLILEGSDRMAQLIDGLLHYAQVGRDAPEWLPVSMEKVVKEAATNLASLIAENTALIENANLPTVPGDSLQLVQMMQNLIGNSIKYSRPGVKPVVRIAAQKLDEWWEFAVQDNGQGIPAEYYEEVFVPLRRLHGSEIAGTGMGLALCKKIVERHGGRIRVRSEVGEGSTFYFTLKA